MPAVLIDGKAIAEQVHKETASEIARLKNQYNLTPGLAVVLVGDNPASATYVSMKDKMCARLGLHSERVNLSASTTQDELLSVINRLNTDQSIHGILVQAPLPAQISEELIFASVLPAKDVDGFHPLNVGKVALGDPTAFIPCTPAGVHELLIRNQVQLEGSHVVILGRSRIVGKPLSLLLSQKSPHANATVTICHSRSKNLQDICQSADVIIAAIGFPKFVTADMVREGSVVIDVGINRIEDASTPKGYRLIGDVDFDLVSAKTSLITPVPGGVGPMTIAMLMRNTVRAAKMQNNIL